MTSRVVARRQPEPWDAPRLGRFEIVRALGAGGMGAVFEAIDQERGTRVALKLLQRERPSLRIRFKGEFRALAGIVHPNVVRVDQLLEQDEALYFTMELLHGVHFLQHVRLGGHDGGRPPIPLGPAGARFDEARLRAALPQLARGLAAIHRAGRVHRDVKPANVLVTPEGRVVVFDLGLALDVGRGEHEARRVGTASFMAPEQAAARSAGPPADWYSVGVLLHVSLTGALPSEPGSSLVPRIHAPGLPRDLTTLCARLLSRDPALRPTGAEVLHALGAGDDACARASAPPPSLSGRERELDALDSAFAEVLGGKPAAVIVAGARGTGKSALLSRFLNLVKDDAIVLSGHCDPREQLRYQAVDEILDGLSRHLARLPREELREISPPDAALLGVAFPALRAALPPPLGEVRPPTVPRARLVAALRTLLRRLSTLRPLVLAVDDLDRADPESIALLTEILRPPDAPALLFLATARSEERACAPAWPARHVMLAAS